MVHDTQPYDGFLRFAVGGCFLGSMPEGGNNLSANDSGDLFQTARRRSLRILHSVPIRPDGDAPQSFALRLVGRLVLVQAVMAPI